MKHQNTIKLPGPIRSVDYKRNGGRFQRCSRCHTEVELLRPVIYSADGAEPISGTGLAPLLVGNELVGFICADCRYAVLEHVCSIFPNAIGFPLVDRDGYLQPHPQCSCGLPLQYAHDGTTGLVCPQAAQHAAEQAGK
jgi:hypothetical protein